MIYKNVINLRLLMSSNVQNECLKQEKSDRPESQCVQSPILYIYFETLRHFGQHQLVLANMFHPLLSELNVPTGLKPIMHYMKLNCREQMCRFASFHATIIRGILSFVFKFCFIGKVRTELSNSENINILASVLFYLWEFFLGF